MKKIFALILTLVLTINITAPTLLVDALAETGTTAHHIFYKQDTGTLSATKPTTLNTNGLMDDVCSDCSGNGYNKNYVFCVTCNGYGYIKHILCDTCQGDGSDDDGEFCVDCDGYGHVEENLYRKNHTNDVTKVLSKKYGIVFSDPHNLYKSTNGSKYKKAVEKALNSFGVTFIKSVLKAYKSYSMPIDLEIRSETVRSSSNNILGEAYIDGKRGKVTLYGDAGITTETTAHEFGHIVHMIMEILGKSKTLKSEWTKNNNGAAYNATYTKSDQKLFATKYGSTNYYEDVATSFELLATNDRSLTKFNGRSYTAISNKLKLVSKWCSRYFGLKPKFAQPKTT